ncbi:MAG: glycosyltransferase, partial [Lachnospiraceae bacterium]|nr:glycosyltransferase [Lachnospiraceae bacterium]
KLEFSDSYNEAECEKKFKPYIKEDEIRILSTSGCIVSRTSDVLVQNIDRVEKKCRLILVGENTGKDRELIDKIIAEKGMKNVSILGKVNQDELKYLINNCHIGIVNYNQNDFNNKFCASGKLYEFIYEGIPVVTTTNPPLKNLCDKYNIGVSDDLYADGINKVMSNYDFYKDNATAFGKKNTVEQNNKQLERDILATI